MQTRRGIGTKDFLLLVNQPNRWIALNAPAEGITATGVQLWAAWWRERIRLRHKRRRPDVSPRAVTAAEDEYEQSHKADRIVQRAAWDGRLRQIVRGLILERGTITEFEAFTSASKSLGLDFQEAFSIATNHRYVLALPFPANAVLQRLMICAISDCGRVFVRAVGKPAQKDCLRCRRRWSPKQRVARNRDPRRGTALAPSAP